MVEAGLVGLHALTHEKPNSAHLKIPENGYTCKCKDDVSGQLPPDDLVAVATHQRRTHQNGTKGDAIAIPIDECSNSV